MLGPKSTGVAGGQGGGRAEGVRGLIRPKMLGRGGRRRSVSGVSLDCPIGCDML